MTDARRFAPAAARNREAIHEALRPYLIAGSSVLEIASGSGEHITHFASAHRDVQFQPSDPDAAARASIDAWIAHLKLENVAPALTLNVIEAAGVAPASTVPTVDLVLCCNMIHIAPWAATAGLMATAAARLKLSGRLALYGPFFEADRPPAPSNVAFDESLRAQDASWGVRDLKAVSACATDAGFGPPDVTTMPANNLLVVWQN
ncbi:MAG: DUF938 domain-containing protein [Pseudomonadota bacterium]